MLSGKGPCRAMRGCVNCCPWSFDACCWVLWMRERMGLTLQQRTEIKLSPSIKHTHTDRGTEAGAEAAATVRAES